MEASNSKMKLSKNLFKNLKSKKEKNKLISFTTSTPRLILGSFNTKKIKTSIQKTISEKTKKADRHQAIRKCLMKKAYQALIEKYNSTPSKYDHVVTENITLSKACHSVALFKERIIYDYIEEFLRKFYTLQDSHIRFPRISMYYKNYLTFFCKPTIADNFFNQTIHNNADVKAKLYYHKKFGINQKIENESQTTNSINKGKKSNDIIFTSEIKKNIESTKNGRYQNNNPACGFSLHKGPPTAIKNNLIDKDNSSIALNFNEQSLSRLNKGQTNDQSKGETLQNILCSFNEEENRQVSGGRENKYLKTIPGEHVQTETMIKSKNIPKFKTKPGAPCVVLSLPVEKRIHNVKKPESKVIKVTSGERNKNFDTNGVMKIKLSLDIHNSTNNLHTMNIISNVNINMKTIDNHQSIQPVVTSNMTANIKSRSRNNTNPLTFKEITYPLKEYYTLSISPNVVVNGTLESSTKVLKTSVMDMRKTIQNYSSSILKREEKKASNKKCCI